MKKLTATIFVLALAILPTLARAGTPPPPPPPPPSVTPDPARCSAGEPQFCLNGTSSSATAFDALRISLSTPRGCASGGGLGQSTGQCDSRGGAGGNPKTGGLRAPVHVAAAGGAAGLLAADEQSTAWGVWASYGKSKFDGNVPGAPYRADLDSVRLGADRSFGPRHVLGAALTYERMDTTTRFNGGGQDSDAYMITPYYLFVLSETFSFDMNAGLGRNKVKQNRIDPTSGTNLNSSFDGTRIFASATLTGARNLGNVLIGGRAGYLEARERQDGYTESGGPSALTVSRRTIKLGQAFAGFDAGYSLTGNLEAYTSGVLRHDVHRSDGSAAGGVAGSAVNPVPSDRTGFDLTLGLRFFSSRRFSGYAEVMKTFGRDQFEHKALNLLVRMDL